MKGQKRQRKKLFRKEDFLSLKTDISMKEVFGNETVRRYFIRDALGIPLEEIKSVRLLNPFLRKRFLKEKQGILDILLELNNNIKINIELQLLKQKDWDKRQLFYLSKIYTADLRQGDNYGRAKRCIAISILDFDFTQEETYHNIYRFRNEDGREFSDMMEIHTVELRKMLTGKDALDDWVRLFNAVTKEELDMIETRNPGIMEAIKELKGMSLIGELKEIHESRLKYRRDMYAHGEYMKDEGIQMEKEETARRMLEMHMDISVIEKATGLSEERIKEIKEKENMA